MGKRRKRREVEKDCREENKGKQIRYTHLETIGTLGKHNCFVSVKVTTIYTFYSIFQDEFLLTLSKMITACNDDY